MVGGSQNRARAQACKTCRVRKRRCIPTSSGHTCQLCQSLSVTCSLSAEYRSMLSRRALQPEEQPNTSIPDDPRRLNGPKICLETSDALRIELTSLYFRYIHNVAHTMFHEISFMRRVYENKAPTLLVYLMAALSARYSSNHVFQNQAPCLRGGPLFAKAIELLHPKITTPSLDTVRAFVLAGTFMGGQGDVKAKHIYMGIARSHAETLCFWKPRPEFSLVMQEEQRRTWLFILIAGQWTAADMALEHDDPRVGPELLPLFDDVAFHKNRPEDLSDHTKPRHNRYEMWAHMAKTINVFSRISTLLLPLSCGSISLIMYCDEVPALVKSLDQWAMDLPANLVYSVENLKRLVDKGLGRTFLAMHIGYFHLRQILFFPFLDSRIWRSLNIPVHLHNAVAQCTEGARIVSDIVKMTLEYENCELNYFLYSHIAVVSSCVHLHALLFSDKAAESGVARECLLSNFEYLMTLKTRWPAADISINRLRVFQEFCRNSMSDPFVLDNWMARFITEHTSILDDRVDTWGLTTDICPEGNSTTLSAYATSAGGTSRDRPSNPTNLSETATPALSRRNSSAASNRNKSDLQDLFNDTNTSHETLVDNAFEWLFG